MSDIRKGMLMVVSGPSGVGKGTLLSKLLDDDPTFCFSVSVTTRQRRENEIEDVHYHFISDEQYDRYLAEDAFLEHATVHAHRYGTLKKEVYDRIADGQNVMLDIDTQGAEWVMKKEPDAVSIFIFPPTMADLETRLRGRGSENEEQIRLRLKNAAAEMSKMRNYRYLIRNDDIEKAYDILRTVVAAEKQNSIRYQPDMGGA